MKLDKNDISLNKYHFFFLEAAEPDIFDFSSRKALAKLLRRHAHLVLHSATRKCIFN